MIQWHLSHQKKVSGRSRNLQKPTRLNALAGFFCFMGLHVISLNLGRLLVSVKYRNLDTGNFGKLAVVSKFAVGAKLAAQIISKHDKNFVCTGQWDIRTVGQSAACPTLFVVIESVGHTALCPTRRGNTILVPAFPAEVNSTIGIDPHAGPSIRSAELGMKEVGRLQFH